MNLDTLQSYFTRSKKTKLYIADPDFLLAGFGYNPRSEGEKLILDVAPYVSYGSGGLLVSDRQFSLIVTNRDIITRRFNTHLRHARDSAPKAYVEIARELSDEPVLFSGPERRVILPAGKD